MRLRLNAKTIFLLTLRVTIAQGRLSHVNQSDASFAAAIGKHIAVIWMELCRRNNFSQLFHIDRFNINNI